MFMPLTWWEIEQELVITSNLELLSNVQKYPDFLFVSVCLLLWYYNSYCNKIIEKYFLRYEKADLLQKWRICVSKIWLRWYFRRDWVDRPPVKLPPSVTLWHPRHLHTPFNPPLQLSFILEETFMRFLNIQFRLRLRKCLIQEATLCVCGKREREGVWEIIWKYWELNLQMRQKSSTKDWIVTLPKVLV